MWYLTCAAAVVLALQHAVWSVPEDLDIVLGDLLEPWMLLCLLLEVGFDLLVPLFLYERIDPALEDHTNAECYVIVEEPCSVLVAFEKAVALKAEESGGAGVDGADLDKCVFAGV